MKQPNNESTLANPVGRFMVAVGAIITHQKSGLILVIQRSDKLDWQPGQWETMYGRIDQFEDTHKGLLREVREETGITDLSIQKPLTVWHIYRGEEKAENELIGITFLVTTKTEKVIVSSEHQAYRWVTPQEALQLVKIEGIRRDILAYIEYLITLKPKVGKDVIGVGVGALIFNKDNKMLLTLRGKKAKNERGKWEIPGGAVEFGETLEQAINREIWEELGIKIEVGETLQVCDHIIVDENQHWVSPTFICKVVSGTPINKEPGKCDAIGWFSLEEAEKLPLSLITQKDIAILKQKYASKR